jgi:hypothetical protein
MPGDPGAAIQRGIAEGIAGAIAGAIAGVAQQAASVVRPEAVASVAATFSFPLALALLVVLFLLVQPRLDDRDPKLRRAPRAASDTLIAFEEDLT